jgi:DNA ligase-associated metallophosphoesterase
MTILNFGNQEFKLLSSGALFWAEESILVVSDLHLEKSSHFAQKQQFIPPYDTHANLKKLEEVCKSIHPKTIMFLGDVFHDSEGLDRMLERDKIIFDKIIDMYDILWIDGNHDGGISPLGLMAFPHLKLSGITFTHEAREGFDEPEISGHFHPCASAKHRGVKIRKPCFIGNAKKLIMPAFGILTGGLDCGHDAIKKIMPDHEYIYMLGYNKVHNIKEFQGA